jgi:hypothetical protein
MKAEGKKEKEKMTRSELKQIIIEILKEIDEEKTDRIKASLKDIEICLMNIDNVKVKINYLKKRSKINYDIDLSELKTVSDILGNILEENRKDLKKSSAQEKEN